MGKVTTVTMVIGLYVVNGQNGPLCQTTQWLV